MSAELAMHVCKRFTNIVYKISFIYCRDVLILFGALKKKSLLYSEDTTFIVYSVKLTSNGHNTSKVADSAKWRISKTKLGGNTKRVV